MEGIAEMLVSAGRRWFGENAELFQFRGGAVIARLFPKTADVEDELGRYVTDGDRSDLEFVIEVLRAYSDGASSTSPICRDIVAKLASDDALLVDVGIIIEQSGMLSGEFGGVEAKASKRDYMRSWLTDPREVVRQFAETQIRDLERAMAADQRRSMEGLQLRKRNWGAA